jgi:type IVB pilus formation R64 PilN family outer membrane protein
MKKAFAALCVISLLAGCASSELTEKSSKVEDQMKVAEALNATTKLTPQSAITFLEGKFMPLRKVQLKDRTPEQQRVLDLQIETNRNFTNLNDAAGWVATISGVPVFVNPELMTATNSTGLPGATSVVPTAGLGNTAGGAAAAIASSKPMSVTYSGSVSGFLDMIAANYGIFWKMEGRAIRLLLNDTRTFRIKALPGDTQMTSTITMASNTSGSSTSGTSSTSTAGTSSSTGNNTAGVTFSGLSVWTGIEASIRQFLTPVTGKVAVSPSTGTISVTDTPRVLDRVAEFVRDQNEALGRQVAVNVRVLSVELSDSTDYGVNWNAVYSNLSSNVKFGVTTAMPATSSAAQFVLQTSTPSSNNWGAASGAIISALSTQGKVSELTSANLITLNNQPAPVNVGRQISYLASSSTTIAATAGSTTSLQPGQVQTGFSMVLLPHIIDGREILMQTSVNISSLLQLSTITSGGSSIQSPDVATSNFIQRVKIRSGDTLVIAGFDQDKLSAVANGVGSATNSAMGSRQTEGKRNILVVVIQPNVAL